MKKLLLLLFLPLLLISCEKDDDIIIKQESITYNAEISVFELVRFDKVDTIAVALVAVIDSTVNDYQYLSNHYVKIADIIYMESNPFSKEDIIRFNKNSLGRDIKNYKVNELTEFWAKINYIVK